uniref:protein ROH1-like n=1 Tax=Erigeron canadensis TaxID=72917 RepID=UPI001CB8ACDF|nr:protein ROH1-like [Erigeron canadensis]XP_043640287.1 protein ROH1-like [Erigeron canadensis]XP_043640288.1 protein ROH1-like [Erigeron canadensis]
MPPTDNQGSFLNRISIRRNQVAYEHEFEDLEQFQKHVADRLSELFHPQDHQDTTANVDPPEALFSIGWFRKLLDIFLCCEAEFKALVIMGRDASNFSKSPLDRLFPEHLDRTVKALDICTALNHGIELLLHWQKLAQIAVDSLQQRPVTEGHVKRAKKALNTLLASIFIDDKENHHHTGKSAPAPASSKDHETIGNLKSLSYLFAKSWSASKQIQAMSSNLAAPRGGEPTGLVVPVYLMSSILVFVMWAMVAAIPCQERTGLGAHLQLSKQFAWAQPMIGLQDKIGEDWKKKEKKGRSGLLEETQRLEKLGMGLVEFAEGFTYPVEADKAEDMAAKVAEMGEICRRMEDGSVPLQLQVRELFHRIVRSRAEALDVLDQVNKIATPVPY